VSRDEAHPGTTHRTRAGTVEPDRPQPPLFTARTDEKAGVIRTRGHLDEVGAEVVCRMLAALLEPGPRRIDVRLGPATVVDAGALKLLCEHARRLAVDGRSVGIS
jgi:hypothetical protein